MRNNVYTIKLRTHSYTYGQAQACNRMPMHVLLICIRLKNKDCKNNNNNNMIKRQKLKYVNKFVTHERMSHTVCLECVKVRQC